MKISALLLLALFPFASEASMHAGELAHALDRLASTGRVLYVAAHPDDENTRLLAWLANGRHVQAAYLSLTRGGGGQNLIGREQGELLDVVRTEELLAARRLDGATQRFSRMRDFGYSKTPDETFAIWGHDQALGDVVQVIRSFQPDVIITRFNEERGDNHGHHTASAILAREAFTAAADPAAFPEQIAAGLQPWQADRLLHNVSHWRGPPPEGALAVDVGGHDARLGLGYGELSALSRSQHKSQGFGASGERGEVLEHFTAVAGREPKKDLLEGLELGWQRFGAAGAQVAKAIDGARAALDRDHPERAAKELLAARAAMQALPAGVRKRDALAEVDRLLLSTAGVYVRATTPRPAAVPGSSVEVTVEVVARRPGRVALRRIVFPGGESVAGPGALGTNEKKLTSHTIRIAPAAKISMPYWLEREAAGGSYRVDDPSLIGAPRGPAALEVQVELEIEGEQVQLRAPLVHAFTDRVQGERVRPFLVVPPATVTPMREAVMVRGDQPASVALRIRAGGDDVKGEVALDLPAGWSVTPAKHAVQLEKAGDEATVRFELRAPKGASGIELRPGIVVAGARYAIREDVIDYPHLPIQLVLQPARLLVQPLDLQLPEGLIGYVEGAADSIAEDLAHVGARVELVDDEMLLAGDLDRYAAVVVGIRAYNTRAAVRAAHTRLMDWVERGGIVVVQYNVSSRWDPLQTAIGPYALQLARDRITNEKAKMTPLQAEHALLRTPNRIGDADFEGWVQERGLYFASSWDERYVPLFQVADPGEQALEGGLLVARHGKGRYVYTGLSFFRQLRAGVPGAYRLFVNLAAGHPSE